MFRRCVFSSIGITAYFPSKEGGHARARVTPNTRICTTHQADLAYGCSRTVRKNAALIPIPVYFRPAPSFSLLFLCSFFSSPHPVPLEKFDSALGITPRARFRVETTIPIRELGVGLITKLTRKTRHGAVADAARRNITQTHEKDSTCTTRSALLRSRNFIYTLGVRRGTALTAVYRLIAR